MPEGEAGVALATAIHLLKMHLVHKNLHMWNCECISHNNKYFSREVVVHSSNPSTWEIEAGWSGLPNYTWLHIQFQVTMIYKTSWVVGSGSCLKCQYLRGWGRKMAVSLRPAYTTKWDSDQPRKQGGSASKQSNAKQKRVIPVRKMLCLHLVIRVRWCRACQECICSVFSGQGQRRNGME